jgi:hypothetical protein
MSILTGRDLQFLASLRTDWRKHYLSEVARLLREDGTSCDVSSEFSSERAWRPWNDTAPNWVAKSLDTGK